MYAGLDSGDIAILEAIEGDARQPFNQLAERVGLSKTPCWNRVQAMENAGVIEGYRTAVDPLALGLGQRAFLQVSVDFEYYEAFEQAIVAHPAVVDCHAVAGEADYLLQVISSDVSRLDSLLRRDLSRLPGVKRFSTTICMKAIKRDGSITAAARFAAAQEHATSSTRHKRRR
ncbi:Lrp/AsnC family transcriptional regulator [Sphingobium sp. Sx8-8]|uniref:Lrp/AsnC family transcriptional regulator n=1 Tax=Sphingobium sp. Sx8-8 TaxID=2933617 RepID=UPI001F597482|nr:Lrp/AsnC family transcriptional regulator [Sphingobium sp. Sx8-8]